MASYTALIHPGGGLEEDLTPAGLARALEAAPRAVGWLDWEDPPAEEVRALEGLFGFHPLALEDATNPETRPKVEEYEGFVFFVTRGVNHNPGERALDTLPLFLFLTDRCLVSLHPRPMRSVAATVERLRKHPGHLGDGPDGLLHHLLDQVVDHYFPILDELEERVERLEALIFRRPQRQLMQRIFEARKEVALLRRSLAPLREVLAALTSGGLPHVRPELRSYFRDVYDHVLRLLESLETQRDILAGLLEAYLTQVSNRMNEVMKTLSLVGTLVLPLVVITSFFGMNFEWMPLVKRPWGVAVTTGLMLALSLGLFLYFRRRHWF